MEAFRNPGSFSHTRQNLSVIMDSRQLVRDNSDLPMFYKDTSTDITVKIECHLRNQSDDNHAVMVVHAMNVMRMLQINHSHAIVVSEIEPEMTKRIGFISANGQGAT
jgi:hypothetical protein